MSELIQGVATGLPVSLSPTTGLLHIDGLAKGEVHVWRADLDRLSDFMDEFERVLSAEEIDRARRFHREIDRRRFIMSRGGLRFLLGRYLAMKPSDVVFGYGPYGKPTLISETDLRFNLSHSGHLTMYAMTLGRDVGIDIERVSAHGDLQLLARHFFSARENAVFESISADERSEAFFACWTRKEAFVKALGRGLSMPLYAFDVAFAPGELPALLRIKRRREDASRWWMRDVSPETGYRAAVVVQGRSCRLKSRWLSAEHLPSR